MRCVKCVVYVWFLGMVVGTSALSRPAAAFRVGRVEELLELVDDAGSWVDMLIEFGFVALIAMIALIASIELGALNTLVTLY